jgi:DNA-binding transcriptional LysR family regulator
LARNISAVLDAFAGQLANGDESVLRVVVGDLCPPSMLGRLSAFFRFHAAATRLHLSYEAVAGPLERLLDGEADLMLHRAGNAPAEVETIGLGAVVLIPVAAPGFLAETIGVSPNPEDLRSYTQCVVRDTARHSGQENHFLIKGAHQCSAPDHLTKRELILQGLAWGHLPDFIAELDLREGRLRSLVGPRLPGRSERLVAARIADRPHGPVAERLWSSLASESHRDSPGRMSDRKES